MMYVTILKIVINLNKFHNLRQVICFNFDVKKKEIN